MLQKLPNFGYLNGILLFTSALQPPNSSKQDNALNKTTRQRLEARVATPKEDNKTANMIFLSFFKTLVGKEIAVELKNDVVFTGTLHSVDQYLNIKLMNVQVVNPDKYPQLVALQNCFIRGSVVRYIQIPPEHVDTELLQDAARRENAPASTKK